MIKVFYKKEVTFHFLLHADCRVSFFPLLWFEGDSNPTLFCSPDLGGRPRTSEPVSEPEPSHSWFSPLGFQMGEPKRINWFQTEIKLKRDLNTGKQNKCSLAGGCGFFYFKKIMVKRKSPECVNKSSSIFFNIHAHKMLFYESFINTSVQLCEEKWVLRY